MTYSTTVETAADGTKMTGYVTGRGGRFWKCDCSRSFDVHQWASDHMVQAHRAPAPREVSPERQEQFVDYLAFKGELEAAIAAARIEGYRAAMRTVQEEILVRHESAVEYNTGGPAGSVQAVLRSLKEELEWAQEQAEAQARG